ncbi:MAG: thioesterase family protein [Chloroflexota bacterium]
MERPFLITLPITVKTYDIDYAAIVHNAVYIRWLEDMRTLLLAADYPIEEMVADGITPILTRTEIDYRLPVRLGDAVVGQMWVANLERTRWTIQAELHVGESLTTSACQTGYFANIQNGRPVRIPDRLKKIWE